MHPSPNLLSALLWPSKSGIPGLNASRVPSVLVFEFHDCNLTRTFSSTRRGENDKGVVISTFQLNSIVIGAELEDDAVAVQLSNLPHQKCQILCHLHHPIDDSQPRSSKNGSATALAHSFLPIFRCVGGETRYVFVVV